MEVVHQGEKLSAVVVVCRVRTVEIVSARLEKHKEVGVGRKLRINEVGRPFVTAKLVFQPGLAGLKAEVIRYRVVRHKEQKQQKAAGCQEDTCHQGCHHSQKFQLFIAGGL